eukprot:jgi/Mesvir1/20782/Mv07893-RA.1
MMRICGLTVSRPLLRGHGGLPFFSSRCRQGFCSRLNAALLPIHRLPCQPSTSRALVTLCQAEGSEPPPAPRRRRTSRPSSSEAQTSLFADGDRKSQEQGLLEGEEASSKRTAKTRVPRKKSAVVSDLVSVAPATLVREPPSTAAGAQGRLFSTLATNTVGTLAEWRAVKEWVVFSDLHVSRKTVDLCVDVLLRVQEEAVKRGAGVIFLGDFWHVRGDLPVEPLSEILAVFRDWSVPTIMIPGNHDQTTAGGLVHALTPIHLACEGKGRLIRVFAKPQVFLDALWLPYRLHEADIAAAVNAPEHAGVKAIFAHLDILGAKINAMYQAKLGLPPAIFPLDVPVYTGHYHNPHTVEGTSIHYVGSPYQVSRAEMNQEKRLLILNDEWQQVGTIPLDLGPRHFLLRVGADQNAHDAIVSQLNSEGALGAMRPGDKLRVMLENAAEPAPSAKDNKKLEAAGKALREMGVTLEFLQMPASQPPRIEMSEEMGVFGLFQRYAESQGLSEAATARGKALLDALGSPRVRQGMTQARVEFQEVELEGYGPFEQLTTYPLSRRGVCVVSGENRDGKGTADSNGAGKTTLVMAPLWALTGSTDPRPAATSGLTGADVVHQGSQQARVRVRGAVNGQEFIVERRVLLGKQKPTPVLNFWLDGEDLTELDVKKTQARINGIIDTSVLRRSVFHGQHAVGDGLLDVGDRVFKEGILQLVATSVWKDAHEKAKDGVSALKESVAIQKGKVAELKASVEASKDYLAAQDVAERKLRSDCNTKEIKARAQLAPILGRQRSLLTELQASISAVRGVLARVSAIEERDEAEVVAEALRENDLQEASASLEQEKGRLAEQLIPVKSKLLALEGKLADRATQLRKWKQTLESLESTGEASPGTNSPLQRGSLRSFSTQTAQPDALNGSGGSAQTAPKSARELAGAENGGAGNDGELAPLCDKCGQEICGDHLQGRVEELEKEMEGIKGEVAALGQEEEELTALKTGIEGKQKAIQTQRDLERRRIEQAEAAMRVAQKKRADERKQMSEQLVNAQVLVREAEAAALNLAAAVAQAETAAGGFGSSPSSDARVISEPSFPGVDAAMHDANPWKALSSSLDRLREAKAQVKTLAEERVKAQKELDGVATELANRMEVITRLREKAQQDLEGHQLSLREQLETQQALEAESSVADDVATAFGPQGIQSFVVEGALSEIQTRAARYLEGLSGGSLALTLSPTTAYKSNPEKAAEKISKRVHVRLADGTSIERSLSQLSGGELRRLELATALGYAEFVEERSGVHCNVIVLDEALQHLDSEGGRCVAEVLRNLKQETVLIVSQAHSALSGMFNIIDYVVKEKDAAYVKVGQASSEEVLP